MTQKTFVIKLIQCVENHPCLWDPSSLSYAKREQLEKAWQEVSQECGKPLNFCRDKWKNVRTGFVRSLRDHTDTKKVSSNKKPFYLHSYLQFLLPTAFHNESTKLKNFVNIYSNSVAVEANSEPEIVKVEDSSLSSSVILDYYELDKFDKTNITQKQGYFSQFGPCSSNASEISQKQQVEIDEPANKKIRITNNDEQSKESKEELALMSFFKGIATDVLSLSIQNQRLFKRKLVELVDDLHRVDV